ncbi:Elongation factor Tu [Bienertia sinuspersici]
MGNYCPLGALTWHKYWRHYKHELKKTFFHLDKKTKEQHYDPVPSGHTSNGWIKLVNHGSHQKDSYNMDNALSFYCRNCLKWEKRHAHSNEDEHGKPMVLIEAWERSHVSGNIEALCPSTSCKEDLEDEAFHDVMNGGKIPERPQGYRFRAKRSDVYRVRGLVTKEGYSKEKGRLEKRNEELSMKYNENNNLLKTVVTQFSEFLDVMRNGNASVQLTKL